MKRLVSLLAAAASIACGGGNHPTPAAKQGQIKISGKATPQLATTDGTAPEVCATFSLQPYSFDSSGAPTLAGSPITITSVAASQTDTIAGCIDPGAGAPNPNWGYLVTATNFVDCKTGQPIPGLSPSTITGNYPVECKAGVDVPLSIIVNVSIAQANAAGYVDISAGVNSTNIQVGCKQADLQGDGEHFGESYIDPSGTILQGLVALDQTPTPTQFGGTVTGNPAGTVDTYYTGIVDPTTTSTILQTFLASCDRGQEYADADHAQCLSDTKAPTTQAQLADVFLEDDNGYVSASLSGNAVVLYSSTAAPNIMDATQTPATLGFNGLTQGSIPAPAGYTLTGVFVDQSTPDQLLVTATDASGNPGYFTLDAPWTGFAIDPNRLPPQPLFSALPDADTQQCLGLFATPHGCITPAACTCHAEDQISSVYMKTCGLFRICERPINRDLTTCSEATLCAQAYENYISATFQQDNNCCSVWPIHGSNLSACTITNGACSCPLPGTGSNPANPR